MEIWAEGGNRVSVTDVARLTAAGPRLVNFDDLE